ncbi:MAG: RsmD family RNA methyltransferase [Rubrivivax sp.]
MARARRFAGSGALGLEAASRGAAEVVLIERDGAQARSLEGDLRTPRGEGVQVVHGDALAWMARAAALSPAHFDLVLLDPPFDAGLHAAALAAAAPLLAEGGFVYVESAAPVQALPAGLAPWRSLRAGAVHAQLLRRVGPRSRRIAPMRRLHCTATSKTMSPRHPAPPATPRRPGP